MATKKRTVKKYTAPILPDGVFEAALQNTSTGLYIYHLEEPGEDKSLRMVFVNEAGAALTGMKRDKMTGSLILDLFPGLEQSGVHTSYAQVVRKQKGFSVKEFQYIQPGLPATWYSFNAFPLPGGLVGVLFENIAEIKNAVAELSLFRSLVDTSNDAVFVVDTETAGIVDVNHTACRRLGYPRNTLLRMRVPDIQEIATTPEQWNALVARINKDGNVLVEGRHKRADGSLFPVEVSINRSELNGKTYFLASARDITERKKMEEAVKEVDTLRGLIPICANCKKIRDDKGFWQRVEVYLEERSSARFTHGLCKDCMSKLYGGEKWFKEKN